MARIDDIRNAIKSKLVDMSIGRDYKGRIHKDVLKLLEKLEAEARCDGYRDGYDEGYENAIDGVY